jgi:glycosyltransferase involved in cell wall biosynthesis
MNVVSPSPVSPRRARALYVCKASFHHYKEVDFAILEEEYDVTRLNYRYSPRAVGELIRAVSQHDFVFVWFASPMAAAAVAAARALGKKSIVVAGGYDVADYAPLRHGMAHRPAQKHFARFALEHCDLVLPVSRFNQEELLRFAKPRRYQLVHNAVDLPPVDLERPRKRQVVTVGAVDAVYSKLKGHERFVEVASRLPDIRFVVAGPFKDRTVDKLRQRATPNVEFLGMVPHDRLVALLGESAAYAQLSYYESFGVAVAEAMWCGVTPVVSRLDALAEVVGETGELVDADDTDAVARAIERAVNGPLPNRAAAARAALFSREVRRERLLAAVRSVLTG